MNWTIVVFGGPIFLVMIWWVVSARHWFKGPKVNVSHMMMGDNVIEGEGKVSDGHSSSDDNANDSKVLNG